MRRVKITTMFYRVVCCGIVCVALGAAGYAQKLPALRELPNGPQTQVREELSQQKVQLESELRTFQADAKAFNEKRAEDQTDAEYQALQERKARYIEKVKAFNEKVTQLKEVGSKPNSAKIYTIELASVRGSFCLENSDGSKVTNKNFGAGRVARVETGTRVTTGPDGHLRIVLPDSTVFTIGPHSDLILDEFVYDTDNTPKKICVNLTKGVFRWITGKVAHQNPNNMKVRVPVAAFGIRGTDVETLVADDGSGWVKLFSGELEITPKKSGPMFLLKAKQLVKFSAGGGFSTPESIVEEK